MASNEPDVSAVTKPENTSVISKNDVEVSNQSLLNELKILTQAPVSTDEKVRWIIMAVIAVVILACLIVYTITRDPNVLTIVAVLSVAITIFIAYYFTLKKAK
jgi:hypothetical protein